MITLSVDELQPGDEIKLLEVDGPGVCTVDRIEQSEHGRRILRVIVMDERGNRPTFLRAWLWKYSRIEVLSEIGKERQVHPIKIDLMTEDMQPAGASA